MSRIALIVWSAVAAAACVSDPTLSVAVTTEHPTAIVRSVESELGISTTVLDLDGVTPRASIELDVAHERAVLAWTAGATGATLELPDTWFTPSLSVWNQTAYDFYILQDAQRQPSDEVELCHQNAAGAGCRRACGPDCETCKVKWVCMPNNAACGGAGGNLVWFKRYGCYERPCCVNHDACYDACGGSALCRRKCDIAALSDQSGDGSGCDMDDANGTSWAKRDATPVQFYHPTGRPCSVEGAVTYVDPERATADAGSADPRRPGDGTPTTVSPTSVGDAATCEPGGPPPPPAVDPRCTSFDSWLCQVGNFCPEDGSCASCVWGS